MFKFLKSFTKKEPETVNLASKDITSWLDEQVKKRHQTFLDMVSPPLYQMKDAIKQTEKALANLEQAKLKNENIPNRAKIIMQGNRKHYIDNLTRFLSRLDIPTKDPQAIMDFPANFTDQINIVNKATQRSYIVLREFFSHEVGEVAKSLKKMDQLAHTIPQKSVESGVATIPEIKDALTQFLHAQRAKQHHKQVIVQQKQAIAETEKTKQKLENELAKQKQSPAFKEYESLATFRTETQQKMKAKEDQLLQDFAPISHALKKYHHITVEQQVVGEYIDNPVHALEHDASLRIVAVLQKMKDSIDQLQLKDKVKEKTIAAITTLNQDYFEAFRTVYLDLKKSRRIRQEKMRQHTISSDIKEFEYRIAHTHEKIERIHSDLATSQKQQDKGRLENLATDLEDMFSTLTGKTVTITLSSRRKDS